MLKRCQCWIGGPGSHLWASIIFSLYEILPGDCPEKQTAKDWPVWKVHI
jgi:hypothetical protein